MLYGLYGALVLNIFCMYMPCDVLPHISVYRSFMLFSYAVCVWVLIESMLFIYAVYVSVVCIVCVVFIARAMCEGL